MNSIIDAIIMQLERERETAAKASQEAHSSATHSENVADNKYDTLATEAAYLAHGQSVRIAELQQMITIYRQFKRPVFSQQSVIKLGALVALENDEGPTQWVFIGPGAGGLKIESQSKPILVISNSTPLAQALLNKKLDDSFELTISQQSLLYTIVDIQ
ncbi:MAG: transcription elongation GreA/GreB family factor [Paraglaciecola psychrophila]|jgi:transcription elongation GreA/GreB family factor